MAKKILTTPIKAEDLEDIHIGDIIYLSGHITTCRDVAHRRLIEGGRKLPVDLEGGAILHAGPIIRPLEDGRYEMVSVGPTTSMRMEKFEREFIRETGVRLVVGKGAWAWEQKKGVRNTKPCTVYFPRAAQLWQLTAWRKLSRLSGWIWECRRLCGHAGSKSSALSLYPLTHMDGIFLSKTR